MRLISSLTRQRKRACRQWPWPMPIGFHQRSNSHKSALRCHNSPVRSTPVTDGFMLPSSVPPDPTPDSVALSLRLHYCQAVGRDTARCKVPWKVLDFSLTHTLMVHLTTATAQHKHGPYLPQPHVRCVKQVFISAKLILAIFVAPLKFFSFFMTLVQTSSRTMSASLPLPTGEGRMPQIQQGRAKTMTN